MRRIEDDAELVALRAGDGVIYNDFSPNLGTPQDNKLHRARCRWLARANTSVPKLAGDDVASAVRWLEQHRGPEGEAWFRCASCLGREATATGAGPTGRAAPAPAAGATWRVEVVDGAVIADLPRTIQFPSSTPLPEWMVDARRALRDALRTLAIGPGQVLEATFAGQLDAGTDLENVLLYNVGIPSAALRRGLRLRREPAGEPSTRQRYRAVDARPSTLDGAPVLAAVEAMIDAGDTKSARRLWAALRRRGTYTGAGMDAPRDVALRVTLSGPWKLDGDTVKRVLDAACAAFHVHDGTRLDEVAATLAAELGASADEVRALALDPRGAALGRAPFLAPWGTAVRVHPADDRITAVDVDVARPSTDGLSIAVAVVVPPPAPAGEIA